MSNLIQERVELARRGLSPQVICRMQSGWAVLGDAQFIRGYSLLLPDPVVSSINDLIPSDRARFLVDMVAIGDALLAVTDAYRINYEISGNTDPWLHAHIFPRRTSEPEEYRKGPACGYPKSKRDSRPFDPARDVELRDAIRMALESSVTRTGGSEG
jgi:diadenosine tetraphosphate (Ap4A) HIT family hydrolase